MASEKLKKYNSKYLITRLGSLVLVFFLVLIINFFLPRLMPGNFIDTYIAELARNNVRGINIQILTNKLNSLFGTNQPLYIQFLIYLKDVLSFPPNFGPSFEYYPISAWSVVANASKWTFLLLVVSQLPSWFLGVYVGAHLAKKKGGKVDRVSLPFFWFLNSFPTFFYGIILILVFSIGLRILPASGAYSSSPTFTSIGIHLILPALSLMLAYMPIYAIISRSAAADVLSSDFSLSMKAQGLSSKLFIRKVVRNSVLPSLTQLFLTIGVLIGNIFVVEYTFSYPGIGSIIANAIFSHDFPVLQASLYIAALVVLLGNLVADLLYPLIDPRVSYAERS